MTFIETVCKHSSHGTLMLSFVNCLWEHTHCTMPELAVNSDYFQILNDVRKSG